MLNGGGHSYAAAGIIQSNGEGTVLTRERVLKELRDSIK
jgi:nanoRNase/pAp phosphatase (c-di-AMP/oligoRNAs hydrolase)